MYTWRGCVGGDAAFISRMWHWFQTWSNLWQVPFWLSLIWIQLLDVYSWINVIVLSQPDQDWTTLHTVVETRVAVLGSVLVLIFTGCIDYVWRCKLGYMLVVLLLPLHGCYTVHDIIVCTATYIQHTVHVLYIKSSKSVSFCHVYLYMFVWCYMYLTFYAELGTMNSLTVRVTCVTCWGTSWRLCGRRSRHVSPLCFPSDPDTPLGASLCKPQDQFMNLYFQLIVENMSSENV